MIGGYNISCDKCCKFRDGEEQVMKEYTFSGICKFQLELKYFLKIECRRPIAFYYTIGKKHYDKHVDK